MRCRYTVIVRGDRLQAASITRGTVEAPDLEDAIEVAMGYYVEVVESLTVRLMSVRVEGTDGRAVTVTVEQEAQ
jgi:hypothetical protein